MSLQNITANKLIFVLLFVICLAIPINAQTKKNENEPSTMVFSEVKQLKLPVVNGNNLYCAGFIQKSSVETSVEIVGADEEKDQHVFSQGDAIYISSGSSNGVKVGDMFAVVRPRGRVNTKWTNKGSLGFYVQEVGAVEVINVMSDVSVARVTTSCDAMLLGDILQPVPVRSSPMFKFRGELDLFAASSGKASGRIVMARDNAEVVARDHVVYIDLGAEDNVSAGEYLTVFRSLGTGNLSTKVMPESVDNKEAGYESGRYRGGTFSNQSARKKGSEAGGSVVTSENAKSRRPNGLRQVVGELMIVNVKESTATAIVVRSVSEIHTGDQVELQ